MEDVFCVRILITRIGDIVSTRLITPTLKIEANPIVRRLGWKFTWAALAVCLVLASCTRR